MRFSVILAALGVRLTVLLAVLTLMGASATAPDVPIHATVDLSMGPAGLADDFVFLHLPSTMPFQVDFDQITFHLRSVDGSYDQVVPSHHDGENPPSDEDRTEDEKLNTHSALFHLSLPKVAAGGYQLYITAEAGVAELNGHKLKLAAAGLTDASRNLRTLNLYFPSIAIPAPRVGARYLSTSWAGGGPTAGEIWVLRRIQTTDRGSVLTFQRAHSRATTEALSSDAQWDTGNFAQIIVDPVVAELSNRYVGKPLWPYGRYIFSCTDPSGLSARVELVSHAPLEIERILRIGPVFTRRTLGTDDQLSYCQGACHDSYHIFTEYPLYVVFKVNNADVKRIPVTSFSGPIGRRYYSGPCVKANAYLVDGWDLERAFTLEDPRLGHPEWPTQLRQAMLDDQVELGMTHEMVALARGFPSTFGTAQELEQQPIWNWYPGAYGQAVARFDGDRLVTYSTVAVQSGHFVKHPTTSSDDLHSGIGAPQGHFLTGSLNNRATGRDELLWFWSGSRRSR